MIAKRMGAHSPIPWALTGAMLVIPWQFFATCQSVAGEAWKRWVIDDQHQGADGVRIADVNQDGLPDIVTGWEESGLIRLYLHPAIETVRKPWPVVTIAKAAAPEDAVACDMDDDGRLDLVSCHEGRKRQVLVHWNNANVEDVNTVVDAERWQTERFATLDGEQWMFAMPMGQIDGRVAIAVGSKNQNASIKLLLSPRENHRELERWQVIHLRDAGWIMSLRAIDMNADGRADLVFTDRKGPKRMAGWLKQPVAPDGIWKEHEIAGAGDEVMFLHATSDRCLIAIRNGQYLDCRREAKGWQSESHPNPGGLTFGKAVAPLGNQGLVMTLNTVLEKANGKPAERPGIWFRDASSDWYPIDHTSKTKFDRIELLDLDQDGDLDVMTCEERRNLGVIWYENPGGSG